MGLVISRRVLATPPSHYRNLHFQNSPPLSRSLFDVVSTSKKAVGALTTDAAHKMFRLLQGFFLPISFHPQPLLFFTDARPPRIDSGFLCPTLESVRPQGPCNIFLYQVVHRKML